MNSSNIITIEICSICYFSNYDETVFFEWINKIAFVVSTEGLGRKIIVLIDNNKINDEYSRELISLFLRYSIDVNILKSIKNSKFLKVLSMMSPLINKSQKIHQI